MEYPTTFGEWLRQSRSGLRLTREQLAGRIGCSVSALRKIEDGERRPSAQIAELLANSLDIPETARATFVRVARGELSVDRLSPAAPPIAPAHGAPAAVAPRSNLPILPTPLIGRQPEVAQLGQLLRDPHCRLLTLVGPGGIGKTRLALAAASQAQAAFVDGVYFVPLAPVHSARYIVPVIADTVGFAFQSANRAEPKTQLFGFLKQKQMLLLMDNLEQLLAEPGVEMVAELLAVAPHMKVLATSRASLGLQGEWVFDVGGLPIPASSDAGQSIQHTAVELFLQRAQRAQVRFTATPEEYPAIVRICQWVDGNPLAVELAAAWVRTLRCVEIADEIERGMDFLSAAAHEVPARHRSMRAVFDYSWQLLAPDEQEALRRLAVFRGGFGREAAEAVAGATLTMLAALVTKSLLRRSAVGRYDLHEVIRQFTANRLADHPQEHAALQARHSRYYLTFFCQADGRLRSAAQREMLAELTAEIDNFRAAWELAVARHDIGRVCQVSATLWYVYELRAWLVEGATVFREAGETLQSHAVESTSEGETLTAIATLRVHSAYFSFRLGKSELAYAALLPLATHLQSSKDQFAAAYALWYLGIVCWELGRYGEAYEELLRSLEKARTLGMRWYEAVASEFMGIVLHEQGDYDQARTHLTAALAIVRELGDPMVIAHVLAFLSRTLLALGRTSEADTDLHESLAIAQAIGYRAGIGHALDGLGRLAQLTDPSEARALYTASYEAYRETGDPRNQARVLSHQGYNALDLGDVAGAQASFLAVLRLAQEGGYLPFALDALAGLAMVWADEADNAHALELVLHILHHPAATYEAKMHAQQLRAELAARVTPQQLEVAQAQMRIRSVGQVVEQILAE